MSRKTVVKARCALCGAKEMSEPRGSEKYCRDCWDKRLPSRKSSRANSR